MLWKGARLGEQRVARGRRGGALADDVDHLPRSEDLPDPPAREHEEAVLGTKRHLRHVGRGRHADGLGLGVPNTARQRQAQAVLPLPYPQIPELSCGGEGRLVLPFSLFIDKIYLFAWKQRKCSYLLSQFKLKTT